VQGWILPHRDWTSNIFDSTIEVLDANIFRCTRGYLIEVLISAPEERHSLGSFYKSNLSIRVPDRQTFSFLLTGQISLTNNIKSLSLLTLTTNEVYRTVCFAFSRTPITYSCSISCATSVRYDNILSRDQEQILRVCSSRLLVLGRNSF